MRLCLLLCSFLLSVPCLADEPAIQPGYFLELFNHPGRLTLSAPDFPIVETSAKPSGSEFGLRGKDEKAGTGLLVFLFQLSEDVPLSSEKCRDVMMRHAGEENHSLKLKDRSLSEDGKLAIATYSSISGRDQWFFVRAFAASGDLCADIEFSGQHEISGQTPEIKSALSSVRFDPQAKQDFQGLFMYATVLFNHERPKEAAPVYEQSIALLPADDTNGKWRRVATDQAVMAYGMSGDLAKARSLANHAIQIDPDYPLNYYNLACADAEEGNSAAAKEHLQQAFDRRNNTLPGESLPDPSKDDSIVKLKGNREFWGFVEGLEKKQTP